MMENESHAPVDKLEVIKATWKQYPPIDAIPSLVIGCLIGANKAHIRRAEALYSAYILAEIARKKKDKEVRDKVLREKYTKEGKES